MVRRLKLAAALCVACAVPVLLGAVTGSAADAPRCYFRVFGPLTRPDQTLLSKATFHCVVAYPRTEVRVAVQKRVKRHWKTVGQTRATIDVAAGHRYTVRTKVPCRASSTFTGVRIRTLFVLRTRSSSFVLPPAAERALCRFTSRG